jgi:hypothetical protein
MILSETTKEIKRDYPNLHNSYHNTYSTILTRITNLSFFKIVIVFFCLICLVVFYTSSNITFLNILEIDFNDTIKVLTTSVITLVSMNLFVTNLLLTHLKDERDDLEKIINRKVRFKFVTYFGFSIIVYLLILNFTFKNIEEYKTNILIFLFYCFLCFIFLLINLYKIVFEFINKSSRKKILYFELNSEFDKILYVNKIKKEFKKKYIQFFTSLDFKETTPTFFSFDQNLVDKINVTTRFEKVNFFRDLNDKRLKKIAQKLSNTDNYFASLQLNDKFQIGNDFLLVSLNEDSEKIKNCFIFKQDPLFSDNLEPEVLNILLKKMENNIKNDRVEELREDLSNINSVFEKFLNTY